MLHSQLEAGITDSTDSLPAFPATIFDESDAEQDANHTATLN